VNDRSVIALSILAGAVLGGAAGFLLLTDRGRRVRRELGPQLDELVAEARRLQEAVARVREAAAEGWRSVADFVGDLGEVRPDGPEAAALRAVPGPPGRR
jgi:gas vesicle protein